MSFLKKHWRFTVPAVVVLCVLLVGVVALYSTSEPPEPKTVYVMPERSSTDNSPTVNTGGIATSSLVQSAETTAPVESPTQEIVSDTESPESCCPEEELLDESASADGDNSPPGYHVHHSPSPEAIEDARNHREWSTAFVAHMNTGMELRQNWRRLCDETAEISEIITSGKLDTLSQDEVKKLITRNQEVGRKQRAAWQKLKEWERNGPVEPTYTSTEYRTSH